MFDRSAFAGCCNAAIELYGSLEAMYADRKAEEIESLGFFGDDEEVDLVFN
jgi:hypothetical protein